MSYIDISNQSEITNSDLQLHCEHIETLLWKEQCLIKGIGTDNSFTVALAMKSKLSFMQLELKSQMVLSKYW